MGNITSNQYSAFGQNKDKSKTSKTQISPNGSQINLEGRPEVSKNDFGEDQTQNRPNNPPQADKPKTLTASGERNIAKFLGKMGKLPSKDEIVAWLKGDSWKE